MTTLQSSLNTATRVVLLKCKSRSCHSSQFLSPGASHLILPAIPTVDLAGQTSSITCHLYPYFLLALFQPRWPKCCFLNIPDILLPQGFCICCCFYQLATGPSSLVHFRCLLRCHFLSESFPDLVLQNCKPLSLVSMPLLALFFFSLHLSFDILYVLLIYFFIVCPSHWKVNSKRAKKLVCFVHYCILSIW